MAASGRPARAPAAQDARTRTPRAAYLCSLWGKKNKNKKTTKQKDNNHDRPRVKVVSGESEWKAAASRNFQQLANERKRSNGEETEKKRRKNEK